MDIIRRLPEELRRYIITFTYEPQPTFLLNDIRHYVFTRATIQEWYTTRFAWEYPNAENDWLDNDLIGMCNQHHATMFGYRDYFFTIFTRFFMLKNKTRKQILRICNNMHRDTKKSSNITWGILTPEERDVFVNDLYVYEF
jgi:hypothetical protein